MLDKIRSMFKRKPRKAKKAPKGFRTMNVHHLMTIPLHDLQKANQEMVKHLLDFMADQHLMEIDLREDHWMVDVALRKKLSKAGKI